jgi:hypothetical protein
MIIDYPLPWTKSIDYPLQAYLQHNTSEVALRHVDQDNFTWQSIVVREGDSGREVASMEVVGKLHGDLK